MEMRYWDQKIRDYVTYETNLVPVKVDIKRHEVVLVFKQKEVEFRGLAEQEIIDKVQPLIPRKLVVECAP